MVYIGQRAAHLITWCVVCVFIPLLWEVSHAWLSRCLPLGCILPTCAFTLLLLTVAHAPFAYLEPMQV